MMANEKVDEIRARHERAKEDAGWEWTPSGFMAHKDRATLLAEVEQLNDLCDTIADTARRRKKEVGRLREEYHTLRNQAEAVEKEVERLRRERIDSPLAIMVYPHEVYDPSGVEWKARLAELVGRLRAELDACDVEEMAYCGGGDGPCGGPAQQPDTVERVRAILADYKEEKGDE